ncbi:hypothetical protein ACZ90_20365 [Streptomyces albus subsp. albus]|nr:hypothetical protein ACZ90_20365 [Streptomyces albus subsp. albus]
MLRLAIAPGPRTRVEITTMLLTSALIPPAATGHWPRGLVRHRRVAPYQPPDTARPAPPTRSGRRPARERARP